MKNKRNTRTNTHKRIGEREDTENKTGKNSKKRIKYPQERKRSKKIDQLSKKLTRKKKHQYRRTERTMKIIYVPE